MSVEIARPTVVASKSRTIHHSQDTDAHSLSAVVSHHSIEDQTLSSSQNQSLLTTPPSDALSTTHIPTVSIETPTVSPSPIEQTSSSHVLSTVTPTATRTTESVHITSSAPSRHSLPPEPPVTVSVAMTNSQKVLPDYQVWNQGKAKGLWGKTVWVGCKLFNGAEFIGEVFADFLGLYDNRYQYVVDSYERHRRELTLEQRERRAARRAARENRKKMQQKLDEEALQAHAAEVQEHKVPHQQEQV